MASSNGSDPPPIHESLRAQVLVVDDSSTVRNVVGEFLKFVGIDVAYAVNGGDGLARLKTASVIKLIFCDVNMPNMYGPSMVEKVRSEFHNQAVHIVMLTTENSPAIEECGRAAGVKGWIVKPFNGAAVIGSFKKLVAA